MEVFTQLNLEPKLLKNYFLFFERQMKQIQNEKVFFIAESLLAQTNPFFFHQVSFWHFVEKLANHKAIASYLQILSRASAVISSSYLETKRVELRVAMKRLLISILSIRY